MNDWVSRLKDQALIIFPNMPTMYVENAIQRTISTFFRETELLTDEAYIDADCVLTDFVIDIPEERTIIQVKDVRQTTSDKPLLDRTWGFIPPACERYAVGYWVDLQGAQPTINVSPCYQIKQGQYCIVYSWTPSTTQCELPHHFTGKYFDALEHGMLANLFLIPLDSDSASSSMARYHLDSFHRAIKNARVERVQNHTNRVLHMHGESFI